MNAQENLMESIRIYMFCAVDLNLYLDNFPDDENATEDYKRVSLKLNEFMQKYEKNYGPLCNFGFSYEENPKSWIETPWPWENNKLED